MAYVSVASMMASIVMCVAVMLATAFAGESIYMSMAEASSFCCQYG